MSHSEKIQKGFLVVIEGTDGSGKKTQAERLRRRLEGAGIRTAATSFPQYGKKSAGLVEEYLNGKYGHANSVDPYKASLFYALDRFDASAELRKLLAEDYIVVLDRYVDANAGHQGGKIADDAKRAEFLKWLYEAEYGILGVPRPELVLILHLPAHIGQERVSKKQARLYIEGGKTHDAHEGDIEHLKNAEAAYLWLARQHPRDHVVVSCMDGERELTEDEIHEKIWDAIKPILTGGEA